MNPDEIPSKPNTDESSTQYPNILNWLKVNNRIPGEFVSNHVLIWIDILGYKNDADCHFKNSYKPESVKTVDLYLQKIMDAYDFALEFSKRILGEDPGIRIFSDNILLYCKLHQDPTDLENIIKLLYVASGIQWIMTGALKILIRGAATVGLFYSNNRFVYGPALIEAYKLETKATFYPRILISDNLKDYLKTIENTNPDELFQGLLVRDEDGICCVNGLFPMHGTHINPIDYGTSIATMRESYIDKSEDLKSKMNYTISKYNEFCKEEHIDSNIDLLRSRVPNMSMPGSPEA